MTTLTTHMGRLEAVGNAARWEALDAMGDADIVKRVCNGDAAAYDVLVRRHMQRAFRVAYRILGHREDAEDLVQDGFLVALERLDSFDTARAFAPWFFRILVNRALNARKARAVRRTEGLPVDLPATNPLPDRVTEQAELRQRVKAALESVPEAQRVAVELFDLEGFSGAEVAEILGIPAGTARWHLHRARQVLREALVTHERTEA